MRQSHRKPRNAPQVSQSGSWLRDLRIQGRHAGQSGTLKLPTFLHWPASLADTSGCAAGVTLTRNSEGSSALVRCGRTSLRFDGESATVSLLQDDEAGPPTPAHTAAA